MNLIFSVGVNTSIQGSLTKKEIVLALWSSLDSVDALQTIPSDSTQLICNLDNITLERLLSESQDNF